MGRILTLLLVALATQLSFAQTLAVQDMLILNSGDYGNSSNNVVLQAYHAADSTFREADTIQTSSAQDIVVEGDVAYIAAQDSIVKVNLNTMARTGAVEFPGVSTYSLNLYDSLLFVGNFYGQADSNLYVYNKNSLQLLKVVGGITKGVKGFAVLNDTIYLSQNETSSSYADSAGYLSVVDLNTLTHVRDFNPGDTANLGQLLVYGGQLYAISSGTDRLFHYNPASSMYMDHAIGANISGGNSVQLVGDTLLALFSGYVGAYLMSTHTLLTASITDSVVSAFEYDTIGGKIYATYTDYFATHKGYIFNHDGSVASELNTGFVPENVALWYKVQTGIAGKPVSAIQNLYPNPATDRLFVTTTVEIQQLTVTNITGQVVLQQPATGNRTELEVSSLPKGVYIVAAQTETGLQTARFIKQ